MATTTAMLTPGSVIRVQGFTDSGGGPAASLNFDGVTVLLTTDGWAASTAAEIVAAAYVLRTACDEVIAANSPQPAEDGLEYVGSIAEFVEQYDARVARRIAEMIPESEQRALAGDR